MMRMDGCESGPGGLSWEDYGVVGAMLAVTCGIGAAYACTGSSDDHLTAGGTMHSFPMALSLATGFITAIELLGNPAEIYYNGTQFWTICLAFLIVVPITSHLFLPVYMELRLTSAYEYLEIRFNKYTRYLASSLYVVQMILYTSVAVYAPALALSHVTGLNTYLAVTIVYVVCIFYASQGGMKAVIITDTFQTLVLIGSIMAVLFIGNDLAGGFPSVYDSNYGSGRIEFFNVDPNPKVRHSLWSVLIGGSFYWATMFCSNQASIQKYLSVRTLSQARSALWISSVILVVIFSINFHTGMAVYGFYKDCDPLLNGEINGTDELLPYYVMKVQGHLRGIPGFFIAGILAASLGTVAAAVNSLAAVCLKDLIGGLLKIEVPESKEAFICKWLAVIFGLISFGLVFVVEQLGSVLQVALSLNGITGGITLGLFSLGMFFPWATSKGALTGALTSLVAVSWLGLTSLSQSGPVVTKPLHASSCSCNATTTPLTDQLMSEAWGGGEGHVSYLWYSPIGCLATFTLGLVVSLLDGLRCPCRSGLLSPPVKTLIGSLPSYLKPHLSSSVEEPKESIKSRWEDLHRESIGVFNQGFSPDPESGLR